MAAGALLLAVLAAPTPPLREQLLAAAAPQPSVAKAGDHAMKLSDGQAWTGLNTGVAIYPGYAGLWTPKEHQHRIRAADLDLVSVSGVHHVYVGRGMVGPGVAQLRADAEGRVAELQRAGVHVFVGSTPDATAAYNAKLADAPTATAGLFHTGC